MTTCPPPATETLRDGSRVVIRPISRTDLDLERDFITALSPEARWFRFLNATGVPSEALLKQLTDIDDERDVALVALTEDNGRQVEVGVARFSATSGHRAEVAVVVSDDWRHRGLGTVLMKRLIQIARERGISALYSVDVAHNHPMRKFAELLGFERRPDPGDATQVIHTLALN
jgi:GNAT superfamily N-acetyltransferase